jgi:hypothetical protein
MMISGEIAPAVSAFGMTFIEWKISDENDDYHTPKAVCESLGLWLGLHSVRNGQTLHQTR